MTQLNFALKGKGKAKGKRKKSGAKAAKPGRKKNGQFKVKSTAARKAGAKGGTITARKNRKCHAAKSQAKPLARTRTKKRA